MADVARIAGVSAMTVSRALRLDGAVSQKTRSRVLEVIDEIGYVPDQAAGSLSSGRSGFVAAIMPTFANPLFGRIALSLADTLAPQGLQLLLGCSEFNDRRAEALIEGMMRRRPEAVAIPGNSMTSRIERQLANAGVPIVQFYDMPAAPIDHVVAIDHAEIARRSAEHLIAQGRRRLGVIAPPPGACARGQKRIAGAAAAAAAAAGVAEPIVLRHGGHQPTVEQGARGVAELCERGLNIDGLICMTDHAAVGAIAELQRRGRRVPDDVAVVGFGDAEMARYSHPRLTTVGFNADLLGIEIAKVVMAALDGTRRGRPIAPHALTLDIHLIVRESA